MICDLNTISILSNKNMNIFYVKLDYDMRYDINTISILTLESKKSYIVASLSGNRSSIFFFLLLESILLVVLAVVVRFCCVFWRKKKLQDQDLGRFLEKRVSSKLSSSQNLFLIYVI